MPLTVGKMKASRNVDVEPEVLEMEMPRRRVLIGKQTQSLINMEVSKTQPVYFEKPDDVALQTWSNRVSSWIACARRNAPGHGYAKRMVNFDDGTEGVAVWRTK